MQIPYTKVITGIIIIIIIIIITATSVRKWEYNWI